MTKTPEENLSMWDSRCTFTHAGLRCSHPAAVYEVGARSGWCVFHRLTDPKEQPELCANLVRESSQFSQEAYLEAAKKRVYGRGDSWAAQDIRRLLKTDAPKGNLDYQAEF